MFISVMGVLLFEKTEDTALNIFRFVLAIFVAFQYWRTIYEERALFASFTGEYTAYRALVPRPVSPKMPAGRGDTIQSDRADKEFQNGRRADSGDRRVRA